MRRREPLARCALLGLAALWGGAALVGAAPAPAAPVAAPGQAGAAVQADELILQFRRPALQAALAQAPRDARARGEVQRALDALAQRHGVKLHYLQTLAVGSALVAMTPAAAAEAALARQVQGLAADAEVAAVEVNARMTAFQPRAR